MIKDKAFAGQFARQSEKVLQIERLCDSVNNMRLSYYTEVISNSKSFRVSDKRI